MALPGNSSPADDADRLESWKEIAAYLKHSERTVRRWETAEGLPAHRHLHEQRGSVYAFRSELDAWRERRSQGPSRGESAVSQNRTSHRKVILAAAIVVLVIGVAWRARMLPAGGAAGMPAPLTSYPATEIDPSFSPDGARIAFTWNGNAQDNYDIYVRPVDSDRLLRLTSDPAEEFGPAWSPDGRTIAFLRVAGVDRVQVVAIPASGGPARILSDFFYDTRAFLRLRTRFLAWRPGSRQLAVTARSFPGEPHALWVLSDDGTRRRLTTPPDLPNMLGDLSPAYGPDGRMLLFTRGDTRFSNELYLLPLLRDGMPAGDPRRVARALFSPNNPVWQASMKSSFRAFLVALFPIRTPGLARMPTDSDSGDSRESTGLWASVLSVAPSP